MINAVSASGRPAGHDGTRMAWVTSRRLAPLVVLTVALVSTLAISWHLHRSADAKDRERFGNQVARLRRDIIGRFDNYTAMLTGGAGLFAADERTTATEFRDYVDRLDLASRFPGVQGLGWSLRVPRDEQAEWIAAMREQGITGFRIWPSHAGPEIHTILYLEPLDLRNRAALGFDMSSDATRRAAMERARDTGRSAASGRVTLVQEIDRRKQAGFLVYVPVYRGGGIPASVAERRDALLGFVYSPFRADDLFAGTFSGESHPPLRFEVYDGPRPSAASLLHRSHEARDLPPARYAATSTMDIAGRPWTLRLLSRPGFEASSARSAAYVVLVLGIFVSLALAAVTWSQTRARAAADANAAGLAASREEIQRLLERERMQADRLREADRRKDEFLAILAHELRNPLAPISNALQVWPLVRDDAEQVDRLRETVTLPIAPHAPRTANEPPPASASAPLPSHRVLVIDDATASCRTLALMLRGIGQQTREANDGAAALAEAAVFAPHVIFCDIAMPGMDGYEVARRIREQWTERGTPRPMLVALTGYGQEEDRHRALAAGFDHHLVKPTNLRTLREIIAGVAT